MTSADEQGKTFTHDVFLSHNQADKPRVRRLAERLRAAGLRVWFDGWIIRPGDDIYLAIERGLEASRTLVLCLSPAALGSDWVGLERSTVLFRDPANAGRRFIPLLLADCKLPDTLRRYKYVDFREDSDSALSQLFNSLTEQAECASSQIGESAHKSAARAQTLAGADPTASQVTGSASRPELSVRQRVETVEGAAAVTGIQAKRMKTGKLVIDQKTRVLGPGGKLTGADIDEVS